MPKLTYHAYVKLLIAKMRTSYIFWGYKWWHVKYVKLKQWQVEDAKKMKEKDTVGWIDGTLEASVGVSGTMRRGWNQLAPLDEPTVHFIVASDELQRRSSEVNSVGWTDNPLEWTVGLSGDQVWTRQRRAKIRVVAPDEWTGEQRFIWWSLRS
jgi:hypothetical protein